MMNEQALKRFLNKKVSVMVKDAPRPSGGVLTFVDDGYIVIDPGKGSENQPSQVMIAIDQIASILVY